MAIYNGRILMRKGLEADFDASKLMAGEWALSTDKGIVRICLVPGSVIRMATYEAFEEDMKQIEAILLECQTIEEAVQRINEEINTKVDAVVEYVEQAKTYRDEAKTYRDEAEAFKNQAGEIAGIDIATTEKAGIVKPDGTSITVDADGTIHSLGGQGTVDYTELENKPSINGNELNGNKTLEDLGIASAEELKKTNTKVDIIIEKADLGIKETASGEEIHLTDSAEGKAVEFALYGKARQNTTSGKNLIPYPHIETTHEEDGITWTDNGDGTVTANGTATAETIYVLNGYSTSLSNTLNIVTDSKLILSGCPSGGGNDKYYVQIALSDGSNTWAKISRDFGSGVSVSKLDGFDEYNISVVRIVIKTGTTVNNLTFKPMIRLASITDDTWEPYTNGASPNPSYPQEIEVSGESYNLLPYPYTDTTTEVNGITFTDNGDGSITFNGTATATAVFHVFSSTEDNFGLELGEYILSGCPSGGSDTTYRLDILNQSSVIAFEHGSGKNFTYDGQNGGIRKIRIVVYAGTKFDNVTFKPMIRKASVQNDRYMPYGVGSVEVKSVGKNLFDKAGNKTLYGDQQNGFWVNLNSESMYGRVYESELKPNTTYTISNYSDGNAFRIVLSKKPLVSGNEFKNKDCLQIYNAITDLPKEYTFNSNEYTWCTFAVNNATNSAITIVKAQLEEGVATEYQPYKETLSTIPTENGLAGIKVSSNGNYTDQNGQQWICDEIVKYTDGSGAYIQRIGKAVYDGVNNKSNYVSTINGATETLKQMTLNPNDGLYVDLNSVICDKFNAETFTTISNALAYMCRQASDGSTCCYLRESDGVTDIATANAWLQENNVTVYYILKEPITTPLTAEELAEISTFYPVTNISNDFDCGMKVKYNCDSKNYIDKRLALIEQALVNSI